MSKRPRIGLNMTLSDMNDPLKAKALCHLKYIDAVVAGGGNPIIIPPCADREMITSALEMLDGFCLIGGPDYLPEYYGGHPQPAADLMHERRHHFDILLAKMLLKQTRQPILGICGGHQLLCIASGGALVQDLHSEWVPPDKAATTLQHSDSERTNSTQAGNVYRHEIKLQPGSRIATIAGAKKMMTNSYHHQAARPDRMGDGLIATAWAPDGVVEALEFECGDRFILGVQWHPERLTEEREQLAIFEALVKAAVSKAK
ncbi:MAG: gamma-glutamyl-gamma-aminobutyrate hydrolase family protein [Planctomycetota bacterium]